MEMQKITELNKKKYFTDFSSNTSLTLEKSKSACKGKMEGAKRSIMSKQFASARLELMKYSQSGEQRNRSIKQEG